MSDDGKASDLFPKGTALRQAIQWIGERRIEAPEAKLVSLIDEASIRFDLSPQEATFLHQSLRGRS